MRVWLRTPPDRMDWRAGSRRHASEPSSSTCMSCPSPPEPPPAPLPRLALRAAEAVRFLQLRGRPLGSDCLHVLCRGADGACQR